MTKEIEISDLNNEGISFNLSRNDALVPVIGVRLEEQKSGIHVHSDNLVCQLCDNGRLESFVSDLEFAYRDLGFILRFSQIDQARCKDCGFSGRINTIQGKKINNSMEFILKNLEEICDTRTTRWAPEEDLRRVLNIPQEISTP